MTDRRRISLASIAIGVIIAQAALAIWQALRPETTWTWVACLGIAVIGAICIIWFIRHDRQRLLKLLGAAGSAAPAPGPCLTSEFSAIERQISGAIERMHRQVGMLEAQMKQQRIVHQSMSTGMMALDLEQRIVSMNHAVESLFGLREEESLGRPIREILHEPQLNRFITESKSSVSGASMEMTLVGHGKRSIHVAAERLHDAQNQTVGTLLLVQDVTRLRELEAIRSNFAANVSHELRTPITNIKGYVETLLEVGDSNPEQVKRFLEIIKRNADRLAAIIEDLLSLARLEEPEAVEVLAREMTPLRLIVEAVVSNHAEAIASKQIRIEMDAPAELEADVDRQLLETAVGNLVANAVKYSRPSTRIQIRASQRNDQAILAVVDEGPGISAEHLPRIFERFYRVDKARSRELGGTGLGLAIVKHIAMVHGGSVEVKSTVGSGSEFRIVLPIHHAAADRLADHDSPTTIPNFHQQQRGHGRHVQSPSP